VNSKLQQKNKYTDHLTLYKYVTRPGHIFKKQQSYMSLWSFWLYEMLLPYIMTKGVTIVCITMVNTSTSKKHGVIGQTFVK